MTIDSIGILEKLIEHSQRVDEICKLGGITQEYCTEIQGRIRAIMDLISPQDESLAPDADVGRDTPTI